MERPEDSADELSGIAIIGMAGRFPGARTADRFWGNIKNGVESLTRFAMDELELPPDPDSDDATPIYLPVKGVLDDVEMFDARFFGYIPREAAVMDPQHRVFLEICWEALERAGYDPNRYPGLIGVYAGCYMDTYLLANLCADKEFLERLIASIQVGTLQTELGNDKDYLATRVSFKLNLRGPAVTVQTACSTSLVAIAHAWQSLMTYQSDMCLAGGVTITLPQKRGYYYREGAMLSGDGHCRPFDAKAAGTVFSNAAGVILMKRVEDAIQDRDTIYAVIRGAATNNDGSKKMSYTAPSVQGQSEVIAMAQSVAGVDPRTIGLIEAHGTATPVGDPIEIRALTEAFDVAPDERQFCAIGSVKSNIGHVDVASGVAGVIKVANALREGVLPPSLHYTAPNPEIDFESSPFFMNTELRPWEHGANTPRRAGVSSFGVGGTNAHVVLEEPPCSEASAPHDRGHQLLLLSALTPTALAQKAKDLADFLEIHADVSMDDVAYTLQVGRVPFEHQRIVVCAGREDAILKLRNETPNPRDLAEKGGDAPQLVMMFPGQGAQFPGMAHELYACEAVFRENLDRCAEFLRNHVGYDLRERIFGASDPESAAAALRQTGVAQPAIFSIEYALAELWMSFGVTPEAFIGHSVGELTAATLAGVFELEDALRLVTMRGRLMQEQMPGSMLSVRLPAAELELMLPERVDLAVVNSPELCVVSGPSEAVSAFGMVLTDKGIAHSSLHTSHAFHSSMMDPVYQPTVDAFDGVARSPPQTPIMSTVTSAWLSNEEAMDPHHWGRNLRHTVRFADGAAALLAEPGRVYLEVGPGQTLSTLLKQTAGRDSHVIAHSSLAHAQTQGVGDTDALLTAVGRLWLAGVDFDWLAIGGGSRRRIPLPTYPFERRRHWVESQLSAVGPEATRKSAPQDGAPAADSSGTDAPPTAAPQGDAEWLIRRQLDIMRQQIHLLSDL